MRTLLIALILAAAPASAQVSYVWSHTDAVIAAPKSFAPGKDVPAFPGANPEGWAVLTAAWYADRVAPALSGLPAVPGLFTAARAELAAAVAPAGRVARLAAVAALNAASLAGAAARIEALYAGARGPAQWIEGGLDAHVVPDIANAFRQVAPLSVELEGSTNRAALLVYQVEQGQVTIAGQENGPALPATRYLVVDPSVTDARELAQCYLMYIPAMKAYAFSPVLAGRYQSGAIFTGRLARLTDEPAPAPRAAD